VIVSTETQCFHPVVQLEVQGLSSPGLEKAATISTFSVAEISESKKASSTSVLPKYHKWRMNVFVAVLAMGLMYATRSLSHCRSFHGAPVEDMQVYHALRYSFIANAVNCWKSREFSRTKTKVRPKG